MKNFILLPLIFLFTVSLSQQVPVKTEQQLEDLATSDNEVQDDQLLLQLNYFKKHPLDINTASAEELQSLFFLTDLQIVQLIRYRNILGKFLDVYELQSVPSWDLQTIETALPFVTASPVLSVKEDFLSRWKGDHLLLFRLTRQIEKSKGFDTSLNTHYLGDRNHLYFRYTYQYKNLLYFGLTADKDPGENFFKGEQSKGFDFYGAHFFLRNLGSIKSIAIGDFALNLGQGLIQWQSMGFGKGSDVMMIKRQSPVLMPYRSAGEFNFNRGIGITIQKKKIEASVFVSQKKITANIQHDSLIYFTSINTSGYHRTLAETEDRNKVRHTSMGANISFNGNSFKIGLNTMMHNFDLPLQKTNEPYNLYALYGKKVLNYSFDYSYTFRNFHLFGEFAIDNKFHKAFVGGALLSVDPKIDLSVLYRNLQKEYNTLLGNAFTESTTPSNERGLFAGLSFKPKPKWQINAYADFFCFPWIKFGVNAPSAGQDYMVYIHYKHNKKTSAYLRYRVKNKPGNESAGVIYSPEDELKRSLRIHFTHQPFQRMVINYRAEFSWMNMINSIEKGYLIYIESSAKLLPRLSTDIRFQFFKTDGYASRIYAYESDVMYGYSIPGFYENGLRYYSTFRLDLNQHYTFGIKWAQTICLNQSISGSGLNTVYGKFRSEIKAQFLMKF